MAESAEKYLKKGSLVYVEGKIKTRSYDDKDGNKKYITEIVVENLRRLDKREAGDRRRLKRVPGVPQPLREGPCLQGALLLLRSCAVQGFPDAKSGFQKNWALRATGFLAERNVFQREAEEAGEAQRLDFRRLRFERAAKRFGAHIDAEDSLYRRSK